MSNKTNEMSCRLRTVAGLLLPKAGLCGIAMPTHKPSGIGRAIDSSLDLEPLGVAV